MVLNQKCLDCFPGNKCVNGYPIPCRKLGEGCTDCPLNTIENDNRECFDRTHCVAEKGIS